MSISRQQRRFLERQQFKKAQALTKFKSSAGAGGGDKPPYWTRTKTVLAILASLATISTTIYAFWPDLEISAQSSADPRNPLNTKFDFKNTGKFFTLYNLSFECTINTATVRNLRTSRVSSFANIVGPKSQLIGTVRAGDYVSRDCAGGAKMLLTEGHPVNILIEATYSWPMNIKSGSAQKYFVSETDSTGRVWMTPEQPPPRS